MQVEFSPEQESQLSDIAQHTGIDAEQLVKQAALRLLEEDARFREGVERGLAAASRGDFVEHAEVWAGIEATLRAGRSDRNPPSGTARRTGKRNRHTLNLSVWRLCIG